jgi:hypothetical protein
MHTCFKSNLSLDARRQPFLQFSRRRREWLSYRNGLPIAWERYVIGDVQRLELVFANLPDDIRGRAFERLRDPRIAPILGLSRLVASKGDQQYGKYYRINGVGKQAPLENCLNEDCGTRMHQSILLFVKLVRVDLPTELSALK